MGNYSMLAVNSYNEVKAELKGSRLIFSVRNKKKSFSFFRGKNIFKNSI